MMIRGYEISGRLIGMLIGGLLVLAAVIWGPAACQKIRSLTAQSKVDRAQTGALTNSAGDAINTVSTVGENTAASEDTTRLNEKDIRNAEGADDAVNPAVRDAGFASLCKRPSFRNSPTGKLRCAPAR